MALRVGSKAPDFELPGVDGKTYSLSGFADKQAVVVIFSCNHCPYVVMYEDRMVQLQADYAARGVQVIAICANDAAKYPADSFAAMKQRAADKGFNFPYVRDDSQAIARAYGAEVTPDVFVVNRGGVIVYRGRIDDNAQEPARVQSHDLRNALDQLLAGQPITVANTEPVGCSIKWK